jgi:hypothetical protein
MEPAAKMTTGSGNPKWVWETNGGCILASSAAVIAAQLARFASHRPDGHLGL